MGRDVKTIAREIHALEPAEQLRLAAGLVEAGKLSTALRVLDLARATLVLEKLRGTPDGS